MATVSTKTGATAWRVTGTVGGKQRKRQFSSSDAADACQAAWEVERVGQLAAMRPKVTRLTHAELSQSEAAVELLRGTGHTLLDAVRHLLRSAPGSSPDKLYTDALADYLKARDGRISKRQLRNYESIGRRLGDWLGAGRKLADVQSVDVADFLADLECSRKSYNNYRDDLAAMWRWYAAAPRRWVTENPVEQLERYRLRDTLSGRIEILTPQRSAEVLSWIETHNPHLCAYVAMCLFAGVRPEGEMERLAESIARHGAGEYVRDGVLYLAPNHTKDGRSRQVQLPANLVGWLEAYPLTAATCRPPARDEWTAMRRELGLAHNVLRHTSVSACAALHGLTEAAIRHGNSERVVRDRYLARMTREQATAFYAVSAKKHEKQKQHREAVCA